MENSWGDWQRDNTAGEVVYSLLSDGDYECKLVCVDGVEVFWFYLIDSGGRVIFSSKENHLVYVSEDDAKATVKRLLDILNNRHLYK